MNDYLQLCGFADVQYIASKDEMSVFHWEFSAVYGTAVCRINVFKAGWEYSNTCAQREQTCCVSLSHTQILPLYQTWEAEVSQELYIFHCFSSFQTTLKEEIRTRATENDPFPEQELWSFAQAMVWTGSEMQTCEIAHRSISPKNFVKGGDGRYKLTGFHFAKQVKTNANLIESIRGVAVTQIQYFKRDVFDFGLVLLQMATLQVSIPTNFNPQQAILRLPWYSLQLKNVILHMLRKSNEVRPSFRELISDWDNIGRVTIDCDHYPDDSRAFVQTPCHGHRCQSCTYQSPGSAQYLCWCVADRSSAGSQLVRTSAEVHPLCVTCGKPTQTAKCVQLPCTGADHRCCGQSCFRQFVQRCSQNYQQFNLVVCPVDQTPISLPFISSQFGGRKELEAAIRAQSQSCIECKGTIKLVSLPCGHSLCKPCGSFYARHYDVSEVNCPVDRQKVPTAVVLNFLSPWMRFTYKFLGIN